MKVGEIFIWETFNLCRYVYRGVYWLLPIPYSLCGLHMRHLPSRRLFSHCLQMLLALISCTHCSMYLAVGQSEQLTQNVPYSGVSSRSANNFHRPASPVREMNYFPGREVLLRLLAQKLCLEQIGDVF